MTDKNGSVELTIFEENLTADGLAKIEEESKTWPTVASNKQDYDLIYEQHQRCKRLRIACNKKADELIKEEKLKFEGSKTKIKLDLDFVMAVLRPLEKQLLEARTEWDNAIETKKKEKADALALEQKIEFERQEAEREKIRLAQKEEADQLEAEADRLKTQDDGIKVSKDKLNRERKEFEIEKGRLNFDEAWEDGYRTEQVEINGELIKVDLKDSASEIKEKIKKDPGGIQKGIDLAKVAEKCGVTDEELAEIKDKITKTGVSSQKAGEALNKLGIKIESHIQEGIERAPFAMIDPAEKEKQLIKEDREKIDLVNVRVAFLMEYFVLCQEEGFQSKTATTELYRLTESIKEAVARFKENLTPVGPSPQKEA